MNNSALQEFRCDCGKLLFKGELFAALVEIKCRRCGIINNMRSKEISGVLILRDAPRKIAAGERLEVKEINHAVNASNIPIIKVSIIEEA